LLYKIWSSFACSNRHSSYVKNYFSRWTLLTYRPSLTTRSFTRWTYLATHSLTLTLSGTSITHSLRHTRFVVTVESHRCRNLRHSLSPQRYFYYFYSFSICSMIWELGFTEIIMPLNCFDESDNSRACWFLFLLKFGIRHNENFMDNNHDCMCLIWTIFSFSSWNWLSSYY